MTDLELIEFRCRQRLQDVTFAIDTTPIEFEPEKILRLVREYKCLRDLLARIDEFHNDN